MALVAGILLVPNEAEFLQISGYSSFFFPSSHALCLRRNLVWAP